VRDGIRGGRLGRTWGVVGGGGVDGAGVLEDGAIDVLDAGAVVHDGGGTEKRGKQDWLHLMGIPTEPIGFILEKYDIIK